MTWRCGRSGARALSSRRARTFGSLALQEDDPRPALIRLPPATRRAAARSGGVAGRVKRKAGLAAAAALQARAVEPATCALCERPLGARVEWHHLVPKSQGGRETAPVHPICHRTIHALVPNAELARTYADPAALRARDDVARFLRWVADKPPDFHAPVRRGAVDSAERQRRRR